MAQALRPVGVALELPVLPQTVVYTLRQRVGADILRVLRLSGAAEMGSPEGDRERASELAARWELRTVPLFRVDDGAALRDFSARDVAGALQIARTTRGDRVVEHALLVVHRDRLQPLLVDADVVEAHPDEATIAGQNERLLYFVPPAGAGAVLSATSGGTTVFEAHASSRARAPDATSAVVADRGARQVAGAGRVDTVVVRVASAAGEVVLRAAAVASSATAAAATVYAAKAVAVRTNLALTVRALLQPFVPAPRERALGDAQAQAPYAAALVPLDADTSGAARGLGFAFGERRGVVSVDVGAGWTSRVRAATPDALAAAARVLQYPVAGVVLGVHVVTPVVGRSSRTEPERAQHAAGVAEARALVDAYMGAVMARVRELGELGAAAGVGPWLGLYSVVGGPGGAAMEVEPRAAATTDAAVVESAAPAGAARVEVSAAPGATLAVGDGATAVEAVAVVAHDAVVSGTDGGFVIEAAGAGAHAVVTTADGDSVDVVVPAGSALVGAGEGDVRVAADGEAVAVKLEPGVVAAAAGGGAAVAAGDAAGAVGASGAAEELVEVKAEAPDEAVAAPEDARDDAVPALLAAAAAEAAAMDGVPAAPPAPAFRRPRRPPTRGELADVLREVRALAAVEDVSALRYAVVLLAARAEELEAALRACSRKARGGRS